MGFRFRLHVQDLPGKPDLVFPKLKKVIEVKGCFWHQHRGCVDSRIPKSRVGYWRKKLAGNVRRDKRNLDRLKQLGWHPLMLWECEVMISDLRKLKARVKKFLR